MNPLELFKKLHREKAQEKTPEEKPKKEKKSKSQIKRILRSYLEKAGLTIEEGALNKRVILASLILGALATIFVLFKADAATYYSLPLVIFFFIIGWVTLTVFFVFLIYTLLYIYIDLLMYQRRLQIEEVFPDFLQLTSANIRAGMTIDKALWYAVRPRFGILAKEIEIVAKETLTGVDLKVALTQFAEKYDSEIIRQSVHILIEGIEAGGEVGDLLNKIASNIQESRTMKQEMSANVTTYVIFISFAAVVAAPILFGLASQILGVIHNVMGSVIVPETTSVSSLPINFSEPILTQDDFAIFVYASLFITSLFSGMMVSVIKYGNVKEGWKYIPIFIVTSIIIFFLANKLLGSFFGKII